MFYFKMGTDLICPFEADLTFGARFWDILQERRSIPHKGDEKRYENKFNTMNSNYLNFPKWNIQPSVFQSTSRR